MNSIIEVQKFEPETTFEKIINDIKYNNPKRIASPNMNLSAINCFDDNIKQLIMSSSIEVAKFEPGKIFENTNNEIKYNI